MIEEIDLIEQARKAGQDYIDSFHGDSQAMLADLQQRSIREGRTVVSLPPKAPHPWQMELENGSLPAGKKAS